MMIDVRKLKAEQLKLAKKVIVNDSVKKINTIAGVDLAFYENKIISAIVVCNYKDFKIIEKKYVVVDIKIPYISGFLFYKEGPAILEVFHKLDQKPDVLMVKGNGILHPRRIGMASHVGILLDVATIGVAKRLMLGEVKDKTIYVEKEARGYELITRKHAKPIYVSPGNKVSLKSSRDIVKNCIKFPHKLPEPLQTFR